MGRTAFELLKKQIEDKSKSPLKIPIEKIDAPKFHDRTYISISDLEELRENIKKFGLIEPIIVREKEDGRFERIAGYRRLEAVKQLGWKEIPAVVLKNIDDKTALALMISENVHRENLTDYDRVASALQYLSLVLDKSEEEIKSFIDRWSNKKADKVKGTFSKEEIEMMQNIEELLKQFRIKSWRTFKEMLRLLNIDDEVKSCIQTYGWKYTIALEVNKLRNEKEKMKQVINQIVEKDLGYAEVKKLVREALGQQIKANPFSSLSKKFAKSFFKLPVEKQKLIEQKLKEIEQLFHE
jgi:ParB family chromosome partitioning protein